MKRAVFAITIVVFLWWLCNRIVADIHSDQTFLGQLKQAGDANSIELAQERLSMAIAEIEKQGDTSGYTSVWYKTPSDDVGFWYKNLKTSQAELKSLSASAAPLEKSNMLIKLRETLLDKDVVTYPNNTEYFWWGTVSGLIILCIYLSIPKADD